MCIIKLERKINRIEIERKMKSNFAIKTKKSSDSCRPLYVIEIDPTRGRPDSSDTQYLITIVKSNGAIVLLIGDKPLYLTRY